MADEDSLPVVARNLQKLIGDESVNAWSKRHGLIQTTINRIKTGKMDPTASFLDKIAAAVNEQSGHHLSGWSLMVEGFDPQNPPVLLRAGSPEHRLYQRIAGFGLQEHAESGAGGDQWVSPTAHPRRRESDK